MYDSVALKCHTSCTCKRFRALITNICLACQKTDKCKGLVELVIYDLLEASTVYVSFCVLVFRFVLVLSESRLSYPTFAAPIKERFHGARVIVVERLIMISPSWMLL